MSRSDNKVATLPAKTARALIATQSDERLVELVREGSDPAFEVIVQRYRGPLCAYCRRILPSSAVEDVLQETFLSAYRQLRADERELTLRPWLFRVAHNAALNAVRRASWRRAERLDESHEGAARPEQELARGERLGRLVRGLRPLPKRQREAIVLRELEGRSHAEIARRTGATTGAVRQLLHRAREQPRAGATALAPVWVFRVGRWSNDRGGFTERIPQLTGGARRGAAAATVCTVLCAVGALGTALTLLPEGEGPTGVPPAVALEPRTEETDGPRVDAGKADGSAAPPLAVQRRREADRQRQVPDGPAYDAASASALPAVDASPATDPPAAGGSSPGGPGGSPGDSLPGPGSTRPPASGDDDGGPGDDTLGDDTLGDDGPGDDGLDEGSGEG
jgi:RNA polymerase sigma factor (sigma-70 family)